MSATSRTEPSDEERRYRELIRLLDQSLESAPGDAPLLLRRARLYQRLAGHQWALGKDPSDADRASIESSEASVAADPSNEFALQVLGDSLCDLAEQQADHEEDPTTSCERAIRAYERALALPSGPSVTALQNGRCNAFRVLGEWLSDRGLAGARTALASAVESSKALSGPNLDLRAQYGAARAQLAMAIWLVRLGEDPGASFEHVMRFPALVRTRILNSAEAAWFSARKNDAVRRWRAGVDSLAEALRAHPDRPDFSAMAKRLAGMQ